MSKKEDQLFEEWGNAMLAELEPSEQEDAKKWLALPIAREVYRGTLAQEKLYTELNKLNDQREQLREEYEAKRAELEEWFETESPKNAQLLRERDELRAQLQALGTGNPPPSKQSAQAFSEKDLAELKATRQKLETLDKLLPAVIGDVARMMQDSVNNKFDFDPREAIKLSVTKGVEPWQAYLHLTAEQRQKREEDARKAEQQKWFEEGKRSVTTNSPDHLQPSGPSVVDYLQNLNKAAGATGAAAPKGQSDRVSEALAALQEVDINQLG